MRQSVNLTSWERKTTSYLKSYTLGPICLKISLHKLNVLKVYRITTTDPNEVVSLQQLFPQPKFLTYMWLCLSSQILTMSHPSWLPPKSTNEPVGHVTARMETTHSFGTPSISVSTQQTPKKFAPVVAPKPKYNPYKQPGSDGKYFFFFFFGRSHNCFIQWNQPLTQAVLDLLFVDEFVRASLFQIIQTKKNVKVSLTLALASHPPEGCSAGRGHGDTSFLILTGSRCPTSWTGTFQEVSLFGLCWHVLIQGAEAWTTVFSMTSFIPAQ